MLRLEHSVVIDRPRELVFAFVTNTENVPKWKKRLVEVRPITSGPVGVGTTETHVSRFMGRRFEVDHEITEYDSGHKVRFRTTSGPFPSEGQFMLQDVEGGTRLTIVSEAEPHGMFRLLAPVLRWVAKRRLERDLALLKSVLEGASRC